MLNNLFNKFFNNKNNKIIVITETGRQIRKRSVKGLDLRFYGSNNTVVLHAPLNFSNCKIEMTDGMYIEIGAHGRVRNLIVKNTWNNANSKLIIGDNFNCNGADLSPTENGDITIGKDCLFSWGINIKTSNDHKIFDISQTDGPLINKPVIIQDHVWVGMNATILKGVNLLPNSVVGAQSVVVKGFNQANIAIAGNPAKIVKENINWA